jgi:hypothetical protein
MMFIFDAAGAGWSCSMSAQNKPRSNRDKGWRAISIAVSYDPIERIVH